MVMFFHRLDETGNVSSSRGTFKSFYGTVAVAVGITVSALTTAVRTWVEQLETAASTTVVSFQLICSSIGYRLCKVGARLCQFVCKSLSKDPWMLSSVGDWVKVDFITPFSEGRRP